MAILLINKEPLCKIISKSIINIEVLVCENLDWQAHEHTQTHAHTLRWQPCLDKNELWKVCRIRWNCYKATLLPFNPFPHNHNFWPVWERSLLKTLWEKEKLLVQAISPFPTIFSTLLKTEHIIFITFNLSCANAFNLVWSKILSCGNGLKKKSHLLSHIEIFLCLCFGWHCNFLVW